MTETMVITYLQY